MNQNLNITYYKPERQGVYPVQNGYCFAAEIQSCNECGLLLYEKNGNQHRIPFSKEGKRGSLYGIRIEGENLNFSGYNYYDGEKVFTDSYAKGISGLEKFGDFGNGIRMTKGVLNTIDFDWEGDAPLSIPYEDTIIYGLNVRAFTMHKSSGVKNKGTFEGVAEKADYLKKLGITAVELMPAYEFDECMYLSSAQSKTMEEAVKNITVLEKTEKRLNCWGFQKGFYFAPKASYSADKPELSFKKMVKTLHKNGIEVMMQFYFPPELTQDYILDLLRYWVVKYHIDGVRLCGFHIPFRLIAQDPVLKETKIRSNYLPVDEIYGDEIPFYRNLASDNGNFRNEIRRYLKGDENLMNQVLYYQKNNPASHAVINYLADYDGFSLFDSVAYERKHNEANGENNKDGTDCNYTWNCGFEGESRKKSIQELRIKQIKNGLAFLFLSQGVPFIFSGDERGNTRFGNNNAYCQDNETGWIKWKSNRFSDEILDFTRFLTALRKEHPVFHMKKELKVMDSLGCGYPDISYHGTEAWCPDISYISRMIGIMLCGKYVPENPDDSFYIAVNMHWEPHELALPKLPKGMKWTKIMSTTGESSDAALTDENKILASGRSVSLYRSEAVPGYNEKGRRRSSLKTGLTDKNLKERRQISNESMETL